MAISAEIIADSISGLGLRIWTVRARYPRFIHAEELTHRILSSQPELLEYVLIPDGVMYDRDLSRNASSSRAVPIKRLIAEAMGDPVYPSYWGAHQPGMQASEELTGDALREAKDIWSEAIKSAVIHATQMMNIGAHKQIVNRILEPYTHITVVITATEWDNFFRLRLHPDAQPEIRELAVKMKRAMNESEPRLLKEGQWHAPFIDDSDLVRPDVALVSAARCARVSYNNHDHSAADFAKDLELAKRLANSGHWSPFEHQALPDTMMYDRRTENDEWYRPKLHRNFVGWKQHRAMIGG